MSKDNELKCPLCKHKLIEHQYAEKLVGCNHCNCEFNYLEYVDELLKVIKDFKKVTAVLGKGIGHISIDADFIALWNETELKASKVVSETT